MRRLLWVPAALCTLALAAFILSFPAAKWLDDRTVAQLEERFPPGSLMASAVSELSSGRYGRWSAYEHVCLRSEKSCMTGGRLEMYAGGLAPFCLRKAEVNLSGNQAGVGGWTTFFDTSCFGRRSRSAGG